MNYIILWKDFRLFVGTNNRPITEHKHPVIQFVVASKGEFKSKLHEPEEWIYKKGLLIKPNHPHQCDASNVPIISMDIEPDSAFGASLLNNFFEEEAVLDYPSEKFKRLDFDRINALLKTGKWNDLYEYFKKFFLTKDKSQVNQRDKRIDRVIEHIHENIHDSLNTEQLMEVAILSESRLLHMFKEQIGLPIRNYILWYRLKVAFEQAIAGSTLTKAAHSAGFSDQSHFSRSCTKMIGIPPSEIIRNSKFVQVSIPDQP